MSWIAFESFCKGGSGGEYESEVMMDEKCMKHEWITTANDMRRPQLLKPIKLIQLLNYYGISAKQLRKRTQAVTHAWNVPEFPWLSYGRGWNFTSGLKDHLLFYLIILHKSVWIISVQHYLQTTSAYSGAVHALKRMRNHTEETCTWSLQEICTSRKKHHRVAWTVLF